MTLIQERQPPPLRLSPRRGSRDRELLAFVGRHGVVSIDHVMVALGVGQAAAYRRVAACIDRGLLERLDLLRREPSLLRATHAGLRYAGLGLPVAIVSPGAVDHWLRCASTAQRLAREFGPERILTERELRLMERLEGRPIASAKLGELPSGHPRLHRPDLAVLAAGHPLLSWSADATTLTAHPRTRERGREIAGDARRAKGARTRKVERKISGDAWCARPRAEDARLMAGAEEMRAGVIAIEVELTAKAPRRLKGVIRAWRRANWVAEVRYYCAPGSTRRAVERAVAELHAQGRARILEVVAR